MLNSKFRVSKMPTLIGSASPNVLITFSFLQHNTIHWEELAAFPMKAFHL